MGLGRFGGGLGAAQWLASKGARVVVTDVQPAEKLEEPLGQLRPFIERGQITLHLGGHRAGILGLCQIISLLLIKSILEFCAEFECI